MPAAPYVPPAELSIPTVEAPAAQVQELAPEAPVEPVIDPPKPLDPLADVRKAQLGVLPPSAKRTGRDGIAQSAAKRPLPPPPCPPVGMPPAVTRTLPPPPVPVLLYKDAVGRDIHAYLNDIWTARDGIAEMAKRLKDVRLQVEQAHAPTSAATERTYS